jgi:hypothetical protein
MLPNTQATSIEGLFKLENELNAMALRFNLKLRASPPDIRAHLAGLSGERLAGISHNLEAVLSVFRICASEDIDPWDDREFFKLSMQALRLSFPSDFPDNVGFGDLIEGYDMNRLQIFRNLRFMELSSYSLMQILAHEWPQLFDRADAITERMISYCDQILWTANRTIAFDIPLHFIRELRSKERQVLEVRFKYLSPLFSGPNQPFGILGTCQVKQVETAKYQDNLALV